MRTVTFKDVMDKIFRRRGMDSTAVSTTQMGLVADFVTERVKKGWEYAFWREWTTLEERAYRPAYYVDGTYAAGDEVWDGATKYYSSVQAANTGHALTDTAWWTDITATMDKYILLDQPGKTRIGATKDIYPTELAAMKGISALNYYLANDRIIMNDSRAGATVFVILRQVAPRFVVEAWSAGGSYQQGWIVYFPTSNANQLQGNCYRANKTETNVEYWELMEIPETLETYVVKGATADYFRNDTQLERADAMEADAEVELDRAYTVAMKQNGIFDMARVVVV
jgi:SpoVK/Ycf46/Vps4 family AAA+-type ATPase